MSERECGHEGNPASYCAECHPNHRPEAKPAMSDRLVLTPEQFDRFKRTGEFDMSRFIISKPLGE